MPAVTVHDILTLQRVHRPPLQTTRHRRVVSITTAPRGYEGDGFPVRRAFGGIPKSLCDPFVLLDQMGEVDYAPGEPKGTPWHPHRGFETVTYMIDGLMQHADSNGGGGLITNGDTQWMTGWKRATANAGAEGAGGGSGLATWTHPAHRPRLTD